MSQERVRLDKVPANACDPVRTAIGIVHKDVQAQGGPSNDYRTDAGVSTYAANTMASSCAELCRNGCVRTSFNRAKAIGIALPPSDRRDTLFTLVDKTLASAVLADLISGQDKKRPAVVELKTTGDDLKEIVTRRLTLLKSPGLMQELAAVGGHDPDQFLEVVKDFETPIADDTYDELVGLTKGNARASLAIISYFMGTFPLFRSTDTDDQETTEAIMERGFRPGNPWEITAFDVQTVAGMVDDDGFISLPEQGGWATVVFLSDDPENTKIYRRNPDGTLINVSPTYLPVPSPSTSLDTLDNE